MASYIRYYNRNRLNTRICGLSPIKLENTTIKLCTIGVLEYSSI
ncbi:hypothetical protein KO502_09055 [Colwellia sp. E2M01]|nr:hypothetical protein [Colwellia sp. E2M01]